MCSDTLIRLKYWIWKARLSLLDFVGFFFFFLNLAILGIEITAPQDSFLVSSSRNPTVSIWARPQYLEVETQCMIFSKGEQSYSELFHTLWWRLGFCLSQHETE